MIYNNTRLVAKTKKKKIQKNIPRTDKVNVISTSTKTSTKTSNSNIERHVNNSLIVGKVQPITIRKKIVKNNKQGISLATKKKSTVSTDGIVLKERLKNYKSHPLHNNVLALSKIYYKKIPSKKFKVGVVITTHGSNNQHMCKICLDACLKYIRHPKNIFLFDNESSDPWTHKIPINYQNKNVTYTRIDDQKINGGLTGTWNMGAKMALEKGCQVVLFLNNDAFVNETVNDLIILSGLKKNAMTGPLTDQPGYLKNAIKNQFIKSNRLQLHFDYKKINEYVNGFCFAINKTALKKNKYDEKHFFNPNLPFGGNEIEWARRHEKKKGNFYICTSCYIEHKKKSSWRNL